MQEVSEISPAKNTRAFAMKAFVLDVDGVLTDGMMHYTSDGKAMKVFGPDDHEALNLIKDKIKIAFVTGDWRGFPITKKRIEDMGYTVTLIQGPENRAKWIEENFGLKETIYMGDSFMDADFFKLVGYSICPADGFYKAINAADYVTYHKAGHRAVAEAVMHIKERYGL